MHGSFASNELLLQNLFLELKPAPSGCDVLIAPPAVYLDQVARLLRGSGLFLAAQDVSSHQDGAHTGECSARMLVETGCSMVIVGHSERRASLGEDDALVARKAEAVLDSGMVPIICVGETDHARKQERAWKAIEAQIEAVAEQLADRLDCCCFAYEPIWAIGSGQTPSAEDVASMLAKMRNRVGNSRLLYGGSVRSEIAPALFSIENVDGVLVGGASLNAKAFAAIIRAANG
ncbi:MAG: triose-phosphate isomerase [Pseudomonadota bacterium]|nr:triose-phosphate isomerase [Pseudomonadota bacterium]